MGLDVSHGCWHGAYSAFNWFRLLLNEAAGYEFVSDDDRFEEEKWPEWWMHSWPENRYQGEGWDDDPPEDPLAILIVHSDCDGIIPHKWTLPLAIRLEQIAAKMPTEGGGHMSNPQEKTLQFARGLRAAHGAGEDVNFH